MCDRVSVMYKGKVVETGDASRSATIPSIPIEGASLRDPAPDPRQRSIHKRHRYAG